MIVLRKLAKPVTGGEPAGLSPFTFKEKLYGKNDLFAVVIAFRYLIPNKDFHVFQRKLSRLIDNVSANLTHINSLELLERMGFPQNRKKITRYRLTP